MSCDRPLKPEKVQSLCNETMKLLLKFENAEGKSWVELTPTMESYMKKNKTESVIWLFLHPFPSKDFSYSACTIFWIHKLHKYYISDLVSLVLFKTRSDIVLVFYEAVSARVIWTLGCFYWYKYIKTRQTFWEFKVLFF